MNHPFLTCMNWPKKHGGQSWRQFMGNSATWIAPESAQKAKSPLNCLLWLLLLSNGFVQNEYTTALWRGPESIHTTAAGDTQEVWRPLGLCLKARMQKRGWAGTSCSFPRRIMWLKWCREDCWRICHCKLWCQLLVNQQMHLHWITVNRLLGVSPSPLQLQAFYRHSLSKNTPSKSIHACWPSLVWMVTLQRNDITFVSR
jgi:hypothetical protein